LPGYAGGEIFASLRHHARKTKSGIATPDNVGFIVNLPNRTSFSPDVGWFIGSPSGMRFLDGAPIFAVEVRSEFDYGPTAEREITTKRRDYFLAGALCVWDVDLQSEDVVKAYFASDPDNTIVFRRGDVAHAGEAVSGWSISVNDLFPEDAE
jgi:Uma2 family endonuclease